jgi:uncharacterized membrane protein
MRPNSGTLVLGLVCGAAVGALIGLALIKVVSPFCIPIGAAIGGVVGFVVVNAPSGPIARGYSTRAYSDDGDLADAASTGCMILGCLGDLSCLGCGTLILTAVGGVVLLVVR